MRSRILIAVFVCASCEGSLVSTGPGGGSNDNADAPPASGGPDAAPAANAEGQFTSSVLPLVTTNCMSCHSGTDGNGWMKPNPDVYATVMGWPSLVAPTSPSTSLMLTKGQHEGPMWQPGDSATILEWVQAEGTARATSPGGSKTGAIDVVEGANTIPLDSLGATGATLTFSAQKLELGLYLSNIAINAGTGGVHVTHPLFVTWPDPSTPDPDPVDSFSDVDMDVAMGMTGSVGGGLVILENVAMNAQLSVTFMKIGPSTGSGGTTNLPGCKNVASFTTNAQPLLSQNCASCHAGGNTSATNATDMTKINDLSTAGQTTACGQILGRVDLVTPDDSGVYVDPDPNSGASHPFKFGSANAFTAYKTSLSVWITAEKTAAGK